MPTFSHIGIIQVYNRYSFAIQIFPEGETIVFGGVVILGVSTNLIILYLKL